MKTTLKLLWLTALLTVVVLALSGCYTQIATKDSDEPEYAEDNGYRNDEDSTEGCCDDDEWESRYRGGFSYYYGSGWPSATFGMAYSDPWSYGLYGSYGYGGYGGYGYGGYNSYYNPYYYGSYYGSYYSPYYYNPYYYYHSAWSPLYRKVRDFGSTRGGGGNSVRGGTYGTTNEPSVNTDLSAPVSAPTGGSIGRSGGGVGKTTTPEGSSVRSGSSGTTRREAVKSGQGSSGSRGSAGTRSSTRRERQRTGTAPSSPAPASPPAVAPSSSPPKDRGVRPAETSRPSGSTRGTSTAPQSRGGSNRGDRP